MRRSALFAALLLNAWPAGGERLPVLALGAAQGLGHDHVRCVLRDDREFLWFCTGAGLARFDGVGFRRFGVADGLPAARVHAAAQTPDGSIWAATERGLARLEPSAGTAAPRFESVDLRAVPPASAARALLVESDGALLVAGEHGLDRVRLDGEGRVVVSAATSCAELPNAIHAVESAADGTTWVGGADGRIAALSTDGCRSFEVAGAGWGIRALLEDRAGRLWIGSDAGLAWMDRPGSAGEPSVRELGASDGFEGRRVRALFETPDGALWVGAVGGLYRRENERFSRFSMANGLPDDTVNDFALDRLGQLWLATDTGGVARLLFDGFVTFDRADGLGHDAIGRLFEDDSGALIAGGEVGGWLARWDGDSFASFVPRLPREAVERVATTATWALQDRRGDWWLATAAGLFRYGGRLAFADLGTHSPTAQFDRARGLSGDWSYRLHESASGALWVATERGPDGAVLSRLGRDRESIARFGPDEGLPVRGGASAFVDGPAGRLLVGWSDGSLLEFDGVRFTERGSVDGYPLRDLRIRDGTLWIATGGAGAHRLDLAGLRPGRIVPAGWSGTEHADLRAIAFGPRGAVALATADGVLERRGDGQTFFRRGPAEGLGGLEVSAVHYDLDGRLWAGTFGGVSRRPAGGERAPAPESPIWIRSLEVDGAALPVSPLGERRVGPLALGAGRHRIRIGWLGLAFSPGETARVRFRVVGIDSAWSAPTAETSFVFAGLSHGRYRFEARAGGPDRTAALEPAIVEWTIARSFWRSPAFAMLLAALGLGAAMGAHRMRVNRVLELERVRSRIAGDLHDDLSASLTRISIQSEVAARRLEADREGARALLSEIGADARALLDSTRDLVWAIDPRDASFSGFVARLRSFVDGLPRSEDLVVGFEADPKLGDEPLGLAERRHLLLLLKEALHNALRHSSAKRIVVRLAIESDRVVAEVEDDGVGFPPRPLAGPDADGAGGRGLRGMRVRAAALGADLEIDTVPGGGTTVRCRVPRP